MNDFSSTALYYKLLTAAEVVVVEQSAWVWPSQLLATKQLNLIAMALASNLRAMAST